MGTNEAMARKSRSMFTKMFPMTFTGSAYLKDKFDFVVPIDFRLFPWLRFTHK